MNGISLQKKIQYVMFTRKEQQAFLEDVSSLVEDGVSINSAVDTVRQIATGIQVEVCKDILQALAAGKNFADGMEGWFPLTTVEIMRAGEQGGTFVETMKSAARILTQQSNAVAGFITSITYPIAVIVGACVVMIVIKNTVFKNFAIIKPLADWPTDGRLLYETATFIEHWWWLVLLLLVGVFVGIGMMLMRVTGEPRRVIDAIPLLALYREITAARFMETLGMLITNGIVLKRALDIMMNKASPYLAWHLYLMNFRLSGGRENIAEVVDTGLMDEADIIRLRVIAKGKGFEHALIRLGKQAGDRNVKRILKTGKIAGGIMLGTGAALAMFMVMTVYAMGMFVAG